MEQWTGGKVEGETLSIAAAAVCETLSPAVKTLSRTKNEGLATVVKSLG